jgi:esterase/lipase superfamily enzyme
MLTRRSLPCFFPVARILVILTAFSLLASCASRPSAAVLQPVTTTQAAERQIVLLSATNRRPNPTTHGYDTVRSATISYQRYTVSIPQTHKSPEIEYPGSRPDSKHDMLVTDRRNLSKQDFLASAADNVDKTGTTAIFVHGYNYSFQEALFRFAQITADANTGGTPVLFSWPSEGAVTGYVADRDSVLASRDDLRDLLLSVADQPRLKRIVLFGHSMGGFLIMETLRELKLKGRDDVLGKLMVVLAAPDIDADVFETQLDVIGKLKNPIILFVSKDDRALAVSSFIGGERQRIGRLDVNDPAIQAAARKYGVRIIDITSIKGVDGLGHDRYASLAKLGPQLVSSQGQHGASANEVGAFVFDAAGAALSSPFRLASKIVAPR